VKGDYFDLEVWCASIWSTVDLIDCSGTWFGFAHAIEARVRTWSEDRRSRQVTAGQSIQSR